MSDTDEYDAFYPPINHDDLVDIEAAAIAAYTLRGTTPATPPPESQTTQQELSTSDEFDSYDFSEFTAEDFEQIDALVRAHTPSTSTPSSDPEQTEMHRESRRENGSGNSGTGRGNGGPRVEITFERAANADPSRRVKGPGRRSPFQQFRSWRGALSVTDLVGPSWCEVQFDYGLRQQRHKKLEDRPSSFVTEEGKIITIVQSVAAENNRTTTRGKSVHKVLEREVQPEVVPVVVTTSEERWGLRLINMLASLQTLMEVGYCREMPVFGIAQDQVVTGIIDEIERKAVELDDQTRGESRKASVSSPNKRPAPRTPTKSVSKKSKHDRPDQQPEITAFFSPSKSAAGQDVPHTQPPRYTLHLSDTKTRTRPSLPPDEDAFASRIQLMLYHRLLANLLASAVPSLEATTPLDFSAFWKRVKVNPTRKFSEGFLMQAGLAPSTAANSDGASGVESSDPTSATNTTTAYSSDSGSPQCLNDLTAAWAHAVEALNVAAVDNTLTLVYRNQIIRARKKHAGAPTDSELSPQEAQDLAAALQASVGDMQGETDFDPDLSRAIFESLKDSLASGKAASEHHEVVTHPFGVPISETPGTTTLEGETYTAAEGSSGVSEASPQAPTALSQEILLDPLLPKVPDQEGAMSETAEGAEVSATIAPGNVDEASAAQATNSPEDGVKTAPASPTRSDELVEADESMTVAELDVQARIIGRKEFQMDNAQLDSYLARILEWWHGQRAPEGVSVELTRRCVTCEYREGCEWREKKAQEAMRKYQASGSPAGAQSIAEAAADPSAWS
ncbi:exonuclease V a 5' deoxyribonuclease-domain-containing protein [Trametes polyzona]|nr:exonuclease V a 5' deoxyribonuclease-domain-containing protein [Trametes polyzona]